MAMLDPKVRTLNQRRATPGRLLALLHRKGPMSRAEATSQLAVARSAVGEAVLELAQLELIRVGAETLSPHRVSAGRGRASPLLEPDRSGPVAATVGLDPTGADLALVGLGGEYALNERLTVLPGEESPEQLLRRIGQRIGEAVQGVGRVCVGVGVGVAGMVSSDGRTVVSSLYLGWSQVPVAELLGSALPDTLPVVVHNDGSLAALAEYHHGSGQGATALLILSCDNMGISGAMLAGETELPGIGHTLEVGHLALDPFGPPCPCGQRGCLELYCDGRALVRAARAPATEAPEEVVQRARNGDLTALRAVQDVANRLGAGLASLVNVLGPDRVVLSGLLAHYLDLAGADLETHLATSIVARLSGTTLRPAGVPRPVIVGAGELVFARLFQNPAHVMRAMTDQF